MKCFVRFVALIDCSLTICVAQPVPDTLWTKLIGEGDDYFLSDIRTTAEGITLICGGVAASGNWNGFAAAIDSNGGQLWTLAVPLGNNTIFSGISRRTDGGYVAVSADSADYQVRITNILPNGAQGVTSVWDSLRARPAWVQVVGLANGDLVVGPVTTYDSYHPWDYNDANLARVDVESHAILELYAFSAERPYFPNIHDGFTSIEPMANGGFVALGFTFTCYMNPFEPMQCYQGLVAEKFDGEGGLISHEQYTLFYGQGYPSLEVQWVKGRETLGTVLAFGVFYHEEGQTLWRLDSAGVPDRELLLLETHDFCVIGSDAILLRDTTVFNQTNLSLTRLSPDFTLAWTAMYDLGRDVHAVAIDTLGGGCVVGVSVGQEGDHAIILVRTGPDSYVSEIGGGRSVSPASYAIETFPNPFNPSTSISFSLPAANHVTLTAYDLTGREVCELAIGRFEQGEHSVMFDGSDLPSGIYFARLVTESGLGQTQKLVLMK